ncbi:MAG: hypothetical protein GXX84_04165 [Acidobacteria bacterium]|nr:hypothetical protein [Acidobacteriota bacterium]
MFCPETFPIILGHEPAASNAVADTSDAICLKGANGVLIIVTEYTAGGDTDLVLTVHEGDTAAVAAAGTYPITTGAEFPIWVNTDCATSDAMVRQTDGLGYTIDATTTKNYMVAFYIPAAILTSGRDWVALGTSGGNAGNIASVIYILDGARYKQTTPPTAIA